MSQAESGDVPDLKLLTLAGFDTIYAFYAQGHQGLAEIVKRKNPQELNLAVVHAALYLNGELARRAGGDPMEVLELVARYFLHEQQELSGVWTGKQVSVALDGVRRLVSVQKGGPATVVQSTDQQLRMLSIGVVVVATVICKGLGDKSGSDSVSELVAASERVKEEPR